MGYILEASFEGRIFLFFLISIPYKIKILDIFTKKPRCAEIEANVSHPSMEICPLRFN